MRSYWHSPDGVLCLFPEWFARQAGDWPRQAVLSRFPLFDEGGDRPPDAALEAFLGAGDPPIIITPGSANAHAERFIRRSVEASGRVGRRALVITRFPEQVGVLPAGSASFEYVPFGRAFPRASAVLHHGGVGTVAQCLAAGVPQLIMPLAHDQPDNAARMKKMGVGEYLYPRAFKPAAIAQGLERLLTAPAVKQACVDFRQKMLRQMSEDEMGALVESMSDRALRRPILPPP
jgi:rhamnosyltransferase subunit B